MHRRLVICADGTWNTKDQEDEGKLAPTNVVKLYEAVDRCRVASDGVAQIAFYHEGIGAKPNALEAAVQKVKKLLGVRFAARSVFEGATGEGIDRNIKDCYRWLVKTYEPGDSIYLFGFSRGAYTVRSLAGMIRNCGVLRDHDERLVDEAYEFYRDRDDSTSPRSARAKEFRAAHAYEADVTCIGVWDTVGALGVPFGTPAVQRLNAARYEFHDVTLSSHVKFAFHALAIDERRAPFAPALWEQQPDAEEQVLEQVWFPGVHCNVGGGYADCGLSDAAFRWMVDRVALAGLQVDRRYVDKVACNACWHGVLRDSMDRLYEVLGPHVRPIAEGRRAGADAPDLRRESVHDYAFERLGQVVDPLTTPYSPANLVDYLQRFPRPDTPSAAVANSSGTRPV